MINFVTKSDVSNSRSFIRKSVKNTIIFVFAFITLSMHETCKKYLLHIKIT